MRGLDRDREAGYNTDVMSYTSLSDLRPLDLADVSGINTEDSEVGYREDGTRVYVKDVTYGNSDTVQSHIAASIFGEHLDIMTPDIAYDDFYSKILMEEMPGDIVDDLSSLQEIPFHEAVAHKMLLGDTDYSGNILVTDGGTASAIDFDSTGREMITTKITLKTAIGDKIKEDLLHHEASKLADQINLYSLEQEMRDEPYLNDEWSAGPDGDPAGWEGLFNGSIDNILDNVETFQTQ